MALDLRHILDLSIKFFFLLTPFFVLSMFLSLTGEMNERGRRRTAVKVIAAVLLVGTILFFLGEKIFVLFGITLDAFRIGAGSLLFLSAVDLVRGSVTHQDQGGENVSVVPLAIPITIGPATTGTILVLGAESRGIWDRINGLAGLFVAVFVVGAMLLAASSIERLVGHRGLLILSKITGLVLSALAAQLIFTGVRNIL